MVAAAAPEPDATPDERPRLETLPREVPGRYEFVRELGSGGQSRVFLAFDHHLERHVAFKVPHADAEAAFLTEARLTARLEHPGIVAIHELGRRDDGSLYAVLELAGLDPQTGRARSLRDVLDGCRTTDERLALLPRLLEVCDALAAAHASRVVHGDVKPENVAVGLRGEVVVLDWGLAVDLDAPPATPRISGTPRYMSPQRARGEPPTLTDDVWSLGTMLGELLEGAPMPGSPLRAIVRRCHAEVPQARYPDAGALATDLRAWLTDGLVSAHRYPLTERLSLTLRRHRRQALAAVLVALVALLGLGFTLHQRAAARRNLAAALAREAVDARGRAAWDLAGALFARAHALEPSPTLALAASTAFDASTVRARHALGAPILAMARAPDGAALALGLADGALVLVSPGASSLRPTPGAHDGQVLGLAWVDATTLLSCGDDGRLLRWDTTTTPPTRRELLKTSFWLNAVAVRGRTAFVTADDGALRWVHLDDGSRGEARLDDAALYGLDVNPVTGQLAVASWRGRVLLVDEAGVVHQRLEGYSEPVISVAYAPDGRQLAAGARDTSVRVWSADGTLEWVLPGHGARVTALRWLGPHLLASGSADEQVRFWDTALRAPLPYASQNVAQDVRSLTVGGDGALWVGGMRGQAWVLSPPTAVEATGRPCESSDEGTLVCTRSAFQWVADGGAAPIAPREVVQGPLTVEAHRWRDGFVLLRRDGRVGDVLAFDAAGGPRWRHPLAAPRGLAVDVRRQVAAVALEVPQVPVFDADGGLRTLETGHAAGVMDVALGGDRLVTASYDKTIRVFSSADLTLQHTLVGHTQGVRAVALATDSDRLASGGWDGTVRLWNLSAGTSMGAAEAHRGFVARLAFAPGGDRLASPGTDGTVAVWTVPGLFEVVRLPAFGAVVNQLEWVDAQHLRVGSGWRVHDVHLPTSPDASGTRAGRRGLTLDDDGLPTWGPFVAGP